MCVLAGVWPAGEDDLLRFRADQVNQDRSLPDWDQALGEPVGAVGGVGEPGQPQRGASTPAVQGVVGAPQVSEQRAARMGDLPAPCAARKSSTSAMELFIGPTLATLRYGRIR
jgi:hypothetical protein